MMNSNLNTDSQGQKKRTLLIGNVLFQKLDLKWLLICIIILLVAIFLNYPSPYKTLVIEDIKTEEILWHKDILTEEWFEHQYIHSVEKSPVIEKFKVDKSGQILTMESWTKSFGAGLPYERQGTTAMVDGFFVLKELNRPIHGGVLQIQPSSLYPHTFHFKKNVVVLSEPPYSSTRIKIEVKHKSWANKILSMLDNSN